MDVDACINAYTMLSDKVFQKVAHRINLKGQIQARFDSKELERVVIKQIIVEQGLSEDALLEEKPEPKCKVLVRFLLSLEREDILAHLLICSFVCAVRRENRAVTHLLSYPSDLYLNPSPTIWEACRATSAASTFFEPINIGGFEEFLDGGAGANNPVRELWTDAKALWTDPKDRPGILEGKVKCLVSIGTGKQALNAFGSYPSELANTLLQIATETEQTAELFSKEHCDLVEDDQYFRFNVDQGLENVSLEESDKIGPMSAATRKYLETNAVRRMLRAWRETMLVKECWSTSILSLIQILLSLIRRVC